MTIDHLAERVKDYTRSIEEVLNKKRTWRERVKPLLLKTFKTVEGEFKIGWTVQELNWMFYNDSVNITFKQLPPAILEMPLTIEEGDYIAGGALVFSQAQSGDVAVFILFPQIENLSVDNSSMDLGTYRPADINERLIIEKVDDFLKAMIKWEVPPQNYKIGFISG